MRARNHSILFTSNTQTVYVQSKGSVVTVFGGAWVGMRIHFRDPKDAGYVGEFSLPLIDGESYFGPREEGFDGFWITNETIPTTGVKVEVQVLDCAQPVVNVGRASRGGFRTHRLGGATIAEATVAGGAVSLYADATVGSTGAPNDTDAWCFWPRGFIGGGARAIGTFNVVAWQHLNGAGSMLAEYARWTCDTTDIGGTYASCSFEFGGESYHKLTASSTRSPAGLLPWPAFGLTLQIIPLTDCTDVRWLLYERTTQ